MPIWLLWTLGIYGLIGVISLIAFVKFVWDDLIAETFGKILSICVFVTLFWPYLVYLVIDERWKFRN